VTEYLGWRAVFWVNVPIGVAALLAASRALIAAPRSRDRRMDLRGGVLTTGTLALVVWALTAVGEYGPGSPWCWGAVVLAGVTATALVRHERRLPDPLLPFGVLRARPLVGANVTAIALTAATTAAMYLSTLYVQQQLRLPPARAALLFPAFNVAVVAGSAAAPRLLERWAARRTLRTGLCAVALGTVVLATLPTAHPVAALPIAFATMGVGAGVASVASTQTGTDVVAADDQGIVAGVLNAAAQVGNTLGVAALPALIGLGGDRIGFVGAGVVAAAGVAACSIVPARSMRASSSCGVALRH
jgi:predicted MFS family arabinose efflux permease